MSLKWRHSLTSSTDFQWGRMTTTGSMALRARVNAMLKHIRHGNADKAAASARDAAHVVHGCWRQGIAPGGFAKDGTFAGYFRG
jgi:hypothetical protein